MAICPIFILMEICPINWAHMHSKSLIFLSIQYLASVNDITNSPKTTCLSESGKVKVTQSGPPLCIPPDYTVHGILLARILEWGAFLFSRDLPNPGIKPRSPAWQAASSPAEWPGKPKNTGVGSLSLLQQIFPTQELNWGLLHCRQILYQLSYQGSPTCLSDSGNIHHFSHSEMWWASSYLPVSHPTRHGLLLPQLRFQ